jgi:hypothetical protein
MTETSDKIFKFKSGLQVCWISLLTLPLGLLAIGGGPCAGPRNALGSTILLTVGLFGVGAAILGASRIVQGFRSETIAMRFWGAISVCLAGFVGLVGGLYLLIGIESLEVFMRY